MAANFETQIPTGNFAIKSTCYDPESSLMEIDQKIELLEKEVQEIKTKGKDFWDILKIAGGLLIPATIAFVGWQYSNAMKNAEIKSATNIAQLQLSNSHYGIFNVISKDCEF